MISWALVWMFVRLASLVEGKLSLPLGLFLLAGVFDIVIVFFVVCAIRGFPKF